ncbi:hypothetical protein [Sphingopyxis fribergensis]
MNIFRAFLLATALLVVSAISLGTGAYFGAISREPLDAAVRPDGARLASDIERRDLAAQESMAISAEWMLLASIVGIALTAGGTGLLLWQLALTRRTLAESSEATGQMREANRLAAENSHAELRAYLSVKSIVLRERDWHDSLEFEMEIQNCGQTPARVRKFVFRAHWAVNKGDNILADHESDQDFKCFPSTPVTLPLPLFDEDKIGSGPGHLIVFGRMEFEDVFGVRHKEPFSFKTLPELFIPFEDHEFPIRLAAFSVQPMLDRVLSRADKLKDRPR